jgi:hypothetical protein
VKRNPVIATFFVITTGLTVFGGSVILAIGGASGGGGGAGTSYTFQPKPLLPGWSFLVPLALFPLSGLVCSLSESRDFRLLIEKIAGSCIPFTLVMAFLSFHTVKHSLAESLSAALFFSFWGLLLPSMPWLFLCIANHGRREPKAY